MSSMFGLYFDDVTNRRVPTIVCKLGGSAQTGVWRRKIGNVDCWVGKKRVKSPQTSRLTEIYVQFSLVFLQGCADAGGVARLSLATRDGFDKRETLLPAEP